MSRRTGFAALGYAVAVGVENMDLLEAPGLGASAPAVRAAAIASTAGVEVAAGGLALLLFAAFAVGLHRRLAPGSAWAHVGLAAGLAAAGLAGLGVVTDAALVVLVDGLAGDALRGIFEIHPRLQLLAGPLVGLFLLASGIAGRRVGVLPAPLADPACVLGLTLLPAPVALLVPASPAPAVVTVVFALFSLWVFATGVWLVLGPAPTVDFVQRATFLVLVLAAGLVGLALLAFPGSTATFFSWGLAPRSLAALAGGAYLGSAVVHAAALLRHDGEVRGLLVGAAVLSGSVLAVTLRHVGQFDFGRLQAWAWIALFGLFTVVTTGLAVVVRSRVAGPVLAAWQRTLLTAVAAVLGTLAVALWIAPEAVSAVSPMPLPPLGGRFAGCWAALLAVLAGWAAGRGTVAAARWPALALVALPGCALLGALRTAGQLRPDAVGGYVAGLALLVAVGLVVLLAPRPVETGQRVLVGA